MAKQHLFQLICILHISKRVFDALNDNFIKRHVIFIRKRLYLFNQIFWLLLTS